INFTAPKLAQVKSSRQFDLTVNDDKTIIFRPFRIKIPEKGKYFFNLPARVWEHYFIDSSGKNCDTDCMAGINICCIEHVQFFTSTSGYLQILQK
ncbi:MAG: hypothetical protein OEV66_08945, partial [Spirochaetia bacterium]|nr:hypothetical protein [Spirochaetia bacterium]